MKNFYLGLLVLGMAVLATVLVHAASPTVEEGNRVIFKVADQETSSSWAITAITWISGANTTEISAAHGMLLEDGAGVEIFSCEATTLEYDGCSVTFSEPLVTSGLKAEDLDAGVLTVFGHRR